MDLVQHAMEFARLHHGGQRDQAGQDYFEAHVLDVWRRVVEESAVVQAVALLHDVLEDTTCTEKNLWENFPTDVVHAVVVLTHLPPEPRVGYYARVRANRLALTVKLADIASNTDPERMAMLDDATRERLTKKYRKALAALT